jgi:hypothetical protein
MENTSGHLLIGKPAGGHTVRSSGMEDGTTGVDDCSESVFFNGTLHWSIGQPLMLIIHQHSLRKRMILCI